MASGPHTFVTMVVSPTVVCSALGDVSEKKSKRKGPLKLTSLRQVFSPEKYQGNPLAIVAVRGNALSQKRKSLIAKEFKFSETVFLHDAPGPGLPRLCEIFTETGEELPFAGHPVSIPYVLAFVQPPRSPELNIHLSDHRDSSLCELYQYHARILKKLSHSYHSCAPQIFSFLEKMHYGGPQDRDTQRQAAVLQTKAGKIPIFYNPYRQVAACAVPFDFHQHSRQVPVEKLIATQPHLQIVPTIDKIKDKSFPLVSIVKGMTFVLVDLTDNPEIFAALQAGKSPEAELDSEWSPSFVGCMYYKVLAKSEQVGEPTIHNVQTRMISHGIEDPGTGSACSALSCYLALLPEDSQTSKEAETDAEPEAEAEADLTKKAEDLKLAEKTERKVFGIQQGVEMGRLCTIAVEVDVKTDAQGQASITNVILSGRANVHLKGELVGP
ncbi:hypothetical protein LTR41_007411 [Exophiala xenobiotica]|nr:hypothetical protein LTR41_007411 [Exophiala xenobiotica]